MNNFSISSAGIGEALQRSASALAEANNDLSQSIALQVGANNVIQNPEVVGNAWKTIAMRIRNAKTELAEAGLETDGMVESTSKLRDLIKDTTKFDIMLDENTFKSTYDIIVGIGKEWKNLKDIDQSSLLMAIAGRQQGNVLAAALNNIKDIEAAYKSAENSTNSALKEQEKYEKSIQYSLDSLKASLQEMSILTVNDGLVKGIVDLARGIIELVNAMGGLAPILVTVGSIFTLWKTGLLPALITQTKIFILSQGGLATSSVAAAAAQLGLAGSIKAVGLAIKSVLATNPLGWILLITGGVLAATKIFDTFNTSLEETQESYAKTKEELESVNSELQTTIDRIDELQAKDSLTLIEKDELSKLQKSNDELERRKRLLEAEEAKKAKEVNNKLYSQYASDYTNNFNRSASTYSDYASDNFNTVTKGRSGSQLITEDEYFQRAVRRYEDLDKLGNKRTDKERKEYEELYKYIVDVAKNAQDYADKIIVTSGDKLSQQMQDKALKMAEIVDKALHPDIWKNDQLDKIFDSSSLNNIKEELISLAKAGKLDDNTLLQYSNLKTKLDELGISSEELLGYIKGIAFASGNLKIKTDFKAELEEANTEVKDFSNNINLLESAYKTLNDKEKISIENILTLIKKFPQYASELVKINDNREDGITLIKKIYELEKQSTLDSLEQIKSKITAENALWEVKRLNQTFTDDASSSTFKKNRQEYKDYVENLESLKKQAEEAEKRIEGLKGLLEKSSITDGLGKTKKDKDVWKDAFQAEYNYLKYQRERDLINAQQYYDKLNALNQKYFANRKQYAEDYRQYDLELYKLDQEIAEKRIKDWEHNLTLKINAEGLEKTKDEQVKVYIQIQNELHRLAEEGRKRGLDENSEYIKSLQNQWWDFAKKIKDINEKAYESQISNYENQISALEKLHDMAMTMEKKRLQLERDSHKERIDAIKSEFDVRKSLLDNELSDYDYEKTVGSKVDEINKIQNQINLIKNDETQKARLKQLEDELKKALDDLNDYQYRHGIDVQKKILDEKEQEAIKDSENQIDIIEKQLDDEVYLRKLADDLIKKSGKELYKQLIDFAQKYGDFSVQEVKDVWKEYESFATNLDVSQNGVISTLDTLYGKLSAIKDLLKAMSEMSLGEFGSSQTADGIISQMKQNSKDWHTSNNKGALEQDNKNLAAKLKELFGIEIEKRKDGYWYYKGTEKRVYHEGGFVDDKFGTNYKSVSKLKSDEVEAILQKGELVISKGGVSSFIDNINNLSAIASKLNAFDIPKFNNLEFAGRGQGFTFEDNGIYNLNGIDDASLSKFKIAKREMIDEAISKFNSLIKNNGSNSVNIKNRY